MTLGDLVKVFQAEQRTECQLLEPEGVIAQAVAATLFYAGYGHIDVTNFKPPEAPIVLPAPVDPLAILIDKTSKPKHLIEDPVGVPLPTNAFTEIADSTEVSPSDWSIIRPLFLLYCEREQALLLESSRVMGVDVFGRASSEVQQDINTAEAELPQKAFIQPVFSI